MLIAKRAKYNCDPCSILPPFLHASWIFLFTLLTESFTLLTLAAISVEFPWESEAIAVVMVDMMLTISVT